MGPSAISGLSLDKRWSVKCIALVLCLVVSNVAEKDAGDACVTVSGQSGTCRDLYTCPSITEPPSPQDTCGFQQFTPIVCCQEQLSGPRAPGSQRGQQPPAWQTAGPETTRAPFNWMMQSQPRSPNDDDVPTTQLKSVPDRQQSNWYQPNRPQSNWYQPNRPPPNRFLPSKPVNRPWPQLKAESISEAKCREYSKPVQSIVEALPLLPDSSYTIKVPVVKCKFNRLQLIVGGTNTSVGEYPHMAALGVQQGGRDVLWACGGSLISDRFVLTAAHCTSSRLGKPTLVRLGELNLKSDADGASPVNYHVSEIIVHPEYRDNYNDIALLRLDQQVRFTENIRPACLQTQNLKANKAVATGWGLTGQSEDASEIMLKVTLDIVPTQECSRLYRATLSTGIEPTMMCAGKVNGGKDTCKGDSGGPLQVPDRKNLCIHYVVGVTSFGQICGTTGVYTRVSAFVPWIESVVWPSV